jgi:ribonuclease J
MNMMAYECAGRIVIVDCGMMFPDAATLGVDVVIPDMTWVFDRADAVDAILLTHAHEDHIGAVPFLAERVKAPVFATPLTIGFVSDKLDEFGTRGEVDLREIRPRERYEAGIFSFEPIHVTHSIVDAVGYAIGTPMGTIVHTGDFKLDSTPVSGGSTDLGRFAHYGEEGVLLLVSDSTNAVTEGYSRSERIVSGALDQVFTRAPGRILVTTFASHIHRIQQIVDAARRHRRKVFFLGRSLIENVATAERLGWLHVPSDVRSSATRPGDEEPSKAVLITTGSQGEPTSALARIALNEHKAIELQKGDTVVLSARTIPGNERAVIHVIDHLFRRGADVIYDEIDQIHVSGHGAKEELRTMLNLTRPKFFIPMHGNLRHLVRHAGLAEETGVAKDRIVVVTNGEIAEIDGERAWVAEERAPAGKVFIDTQFEEISDVVVRDRQHLAEDGFVIVVAALDMNSGRLAREPEIITRGLIHVDASADVLASVRDLLLAVFEENRPEELRDPEIVQEKMRSVLKRYFRKKMNRRPLILPVVWEM